MKSTRVFARIALITANLNRETSRTNDTSAATEGDVHAGVLTTKQTKHTKVLSRFDIYVVAAQYHVRLHGAL